MKSGVIAHVFSQDHKRSFLNALTFPYFEIMNLFVSAIQRKVCLAMDFSNFLRILSSFLRICGGRPANHGMLASPALKHI